MLKGAHGTVSIIDKATQPIRNIAKAFLGLGDASKKAGKDVGKIQQSINFLGRTNQNIKNQTKDIAGQAVGVYALAQSFKGIVNPAIQFETAFAGVKKVADGTPEEIEALRKGLLKLSTTMPNTAVELSEIAAAGASMGFAAKDLVNFSQIVAKASTAFDMSAEDSGEAFGKIASMLGYGMKDLEDYGDRVNYLADALSAKAPNIIDITKRTAGAMASLKLGKGDITGLAAFADQMSVSAEIGASALNQIIGEMRKTKKGSELLEKEGAKGILTFAESFKDLEGIKLATAIKDAMGEGEGARLFEKMINQSEALKKALDLGNETKAVGSMTREFNAMANTSANKMKVFGNIIDRVAIIIGDNLLPSVKSLIDKLSPLVDSFGEFIKTNKEAIQVVASFGIMILGAKGVALAYTAALWLVSPAITAITFALGLAKKAVIAFNLFAAANPFGAMITAIGLVSAAVYLLIDNWDAVTDAVSRFIDKFKSFDFGNFFKSFGELGTNLGLNFFQEESKTVNIGTLIPQDTSNPVVSPQIQQMLDATKGNETINNQANININIEDGKTKSVNTTGDFKTKVVLDNGRQE